MFSDVNRCMYVGMGFATRIFRIMVKPVMWDTVLEVYSSDTLKNKGKFEDNQNKLWRYRGVLVSWKLKNITVLQGLHIVYPSLH